MTLRPLALALVAPLALGAQQTRITLSAAPLVRIGADGDTAAEFTRVTGAVQLRSGQLLVTDVRTRAVRVFGADGRFQRDLGRFGAGPGEFRSVSLLPPAGDTVLVWDGTLRRLTRYLPDGHLIGSMQVIASGGAQRIGLVGRLPNGRWLVGTSYMPSLMRPGGTYEDSIRAGTVAASGDGGVSWIGWHPGATFWVWKPNASADHGESVGIARLSAYTHLLVAGPNIVVASGSTNRIHLLDATGRVVGQFGTPTRQQPVSDAARERARDDALAQARDERSRAFVAASFERSAIPRVAPAFDDVHAGPGELWLQDFVADPSSPQRCTVMALDGTVVARLALPPRARVLDVGADFVWLAVTDDDGVEQLEKYALRRR